MGKRKTVRKDDSSLNLTPDNIKDTSISSPADWLSSIQTSHNQDDNMKGSPHSTFLESVAHNLRSSRNTPELRIKLQKLNSDDFREPIISGHSSSEDNDSVEKDTVISPTSGLKTTNFYGTKTKSFQVSFRKASSDVSEKERKKEQTRKNGKIGSLKRKHKSPKNSRTKNQAVKRTKKDHGSKSVEIKGSNDERMCNGVIHNEDVGCLDNQCKPPGTILNIITPEPSSSSSEIVDLMTSTKQNGITKECNGTDIIMPESSSSSSEIVDLLANGTDIITPETSLSSQTKDLTASKELNGRINDCKGTTTNQENHILNSYNSKGVVDDLKSELGSLHSEDSLVSGFGSVKSSTLIKGQNGEYYFSNSDESSPELTINGRSKFFHTPKISSLSNSPESETSSTANSERTVVLFSGAKESGGSSYSPSCNSSNSTNSVSPELQTSITSFFKCTTKQGGEAVSPKNKKQDRLQGAKSNKKKEQMYLDLGQRNFGHVTCTTCGMVYTHAQPDDELEHIRHHKKFVNGLRFQGWKDEHVVKEFSDGRIIMVKPDDHPSHQRKSEEIRKVVDSELGFAVDLPYRKNESKTFLFIANKRVVGCCVATQIDKGYPVLPSTPTKDNTPDRQIAAWCCSTVPVPAQCGISKIWVWNRYRRKRVATRLIESVRTHFIYGCIIPKEVLAFSDPTPDGKRLATAYVGTPEFLVFH